VGLRAKMYSLWTPEDSKFSFEKANGIQKNIWLKKVRHKHFLNVLFLRSNHVINTVEVNVLGLSGFDTF